MPPKVRLVAGEKPPPKRRRRAADSDDDDDTSSAGTSSGAEDSAASSDSESDSSSNEGSSESGSSSAEEESSDDGRKKRPAAGGRGRGAGRGRGRAAGTATAAAPKAPRAKRQSRTADSSDDESPKKKKRAAAPRAKRGAKKKAAEGEEDDDDSASSGGEAATGRRGGGAAAAAARRRTSAASRADGGVNGVTFDILPFPHPMTYLGPLIRHAHPSNPTAGPRLMPLVKPYRGLGASAANAASTTTANPAAPAAPAPPPPPPLLPFVDVLDASPVAAPVAGCLAALYVATIQQQNATDAAIKAAASSAGASASSTPTPSRGKLKPEAALRHRNATSALINTLRLLAADAKAVEAIEADEDEEDRKEREAAAKAREERRKRRLEALAAEEAAYAAALAAAAAAAEGGEDETDNANTNNNSGDNVKQEEAAEQQKEQQEGPDQQQQQSSAAAAAVDDDNDFEEEEKSVALARLRRLIGPQIEAALGSDAKANKRANKSQAVLSAMLERLKRCLFVSYSTAGPPAAAIAIDPTIASPYGSAYANASAGTGMGGGGVYLTSAPSSLSPAFAINSKTGLPSSPAGPQYSPAATHGLHCLFFDDYCDASDHLLRRHGGVVCGPAADAAGYSEPPCVSGAKELLRTVGLAPSTHPTTAAAGGSAASDESIVAAFENSRGGGNKRDREDGVTAAAGSSTTGGGRRTETSAVDRRREREQREREKARAAMAVTTNCPPSFSQHLAHYGVFPSRCQPTAVAHVATVLGGAVSAPQPVLNLAAHHRRTGNSNSIPLQPHTSPLGTLNAVIACDVKAAALTEDGRVVVVGLVPTGGAAPTTYSGAHQPLGSLRLQRIAGLALPGGLLPTSIAVAPLCPQTAALDSNAASASAARKEIPKVDAYTVANGNEERPAAEITAKMRLALDHLAADAVKGTDFYLRTNVDNFVQFRKEVLQPFCFGMAWGSGSVGGGSSSASSASASAKSAAAASLSLATAAALSAGGKGGHHHPHVNAAVKGGGGNSNTNKNSISFLPDVRIAVGTQHLKVFLCVCRVAYSPIVSVQSDADSAAEAAAAAEQQRQRDEERMRKEKEKEENAVAAAAASSSSLQQQSTTGAASSGGNGASAMALANALPMISTMLRKGSGGDTAERNPSAAAFLLRKRQQLEQRIAAAAAEKAGGGAAAAKPRPLATRINRAAGECLSADRSEFFILKCFTPSLDGISSVSSTLLSPIASMAFALPADYRLRFYAAMDESMDEVPYIGAGGNGGPLRPSLIGRTFAMYYLSTIPCSRKGLPGYQISQAPREVADCLMASYSADAPNSAGSGGFGCDVGPHGNFRLDPWRGDSAASEEEAAALVGMSAPTFLPSPLAPLESYAAAALRTNTFDPSARLDARQRGPNPLSDGADSSAAGALRSSARVGPDGGPRNYSSSEVAYFLAPHAPTQALLVTSQGPHQQEWSCDVGVGSGARLGNANALTSQTSMNAMGIYPMSLSANRTEPATFNAASSVNLVAERNIPQSLAADGFPFADAASNAAAPISAFVAGSALPALAYEQSVMTNALPTHEVMAGGNGVTAATPTAVVSRVMAQLRVRSVFAGGFASAQREGDVSARSIGVCESLREMMARAAALAEGRGAGEGEEDASSSAVGGELNPFATPTVKKKATAQSSAVAAAGQQQQQLPFAQLLCFAKGWPQTVIPLDTYSFFRSKFPRGGFADDDSGTLEGNTAPYYCGVGAAAAAVDPAAEPSVASNDVLALRWMPRATTGYTIPAPAPSVPPTSSADPSAVAPAEVRAAAANATASRTVLLRALEGVLANEPVLVPELLAVLRRNQMVMVAFK